MNALDRHLVNTIAARMREDCTSMKATAVYFSAIITLVALQVPDKVWAKLLSEAAKPCGEPECDCEKYMENIFLAISASREFQKRHAK